MQSFDNPPDFDFKRDPLETQAERLRRKLAKRDARIAGLERRVAELEHQIAVQHRQTDMLPIEVTRAVQRALCNVRMIPVIGIGGSDRILEVRPAAEPHNAEVTCPPRAGHRSNDEQDQG